MNLLNEISQRYPAAVSFAAGRPHEDLFEVDDVHHYLRTFCDHLRADRGWSEREVARSLFQYGRTKGIIHELVANNLAQDEGIHVDPEAVVVTVGCQEAMFLVLRALCADPRDVVLAVSPTYVGLSGAAQLLDVPVLPVRTGVAGVDLEDLAAAVRRARTSGLRPRAFYVIPDFSNPLGTSMDLTARRGLLDLAEEHDLLLLEDNPYGLFSAGSDRLPTLKALDGRQRVVYLGSFAKTALPGARVGYAVADQRVTDAAGEDLGFFADQLSKVKSMLTVNTPPLAQAVVGGKLLKHGGSLIAANVREAAIYRRNLRLLLDGLARRFPGPQQGPEVTWNVPGGGFFLVLTVPFRTDDALLEHSASHHQVLWTPLHHFYDGKEPTRQLRLSFSLLNPEQIELGLDRLADLIHEQCGTHHPRHPTTSAA
jgi:(S)-3,5-dihydroxyphenylglycine transaminase